jgi:hypothetical protein
MRFVQKIFDRVNSGKLFGPEGATNGRVTVEPGWMLRPTTPVYGNSEKGPFRYYLDENRTEYEIPSIQRIEITRSLDQEIATCRITVYNAWHEANELSAELAGQLGKPGFFWPKHGPEVKSEWNHSLSKGAYTKEGLWDSEFSWRNVLVEDALIRTYQGYGGKPSPSDTVFKSVQDNLDNENVLLTGVWIVDTVIGNNAGTLILNCRDVGRLLLDQIVFPPTVPSQVYPLEYVPPGRSAFDSPWGPKSISDPSRAGSRGPINITPATSSSLEDGTGDNYTALHPLEDSRDGNIQNFALTEAFESRVSGPDLTDTAYFEYDVENEPISSVSVVGWAGGYKVYVSLMVNGVWQQIDAVDAKGNSENSQVDPGIIPANDNDKEIPYAGYAYIPETTPGGDSMRGEPEVYIDTYRTFPESEVAAATAMTERQREQRYGQSTVPEVGQKVQYYNVEKIRVSLQRFVYSGMPNGDGDQYRAGLRTVKAFCKGVLTNPYDFDAANINWTTRIESHPVRGYWVVEMSGWVHGFGDAADYDSDSFGNVADDWEVNKTWQPWAPGGSVTANGTVYGNSQYQYQHLTYGSTATTSPYSTYTHKPSLRVAGMASTPSGKGYWLVDWCGNVYAYGDAQVNGDGFRDHFGEFAVPHPGAGADYRAVLSRDGDPGFKSRNTSGYYNVDGQWVAQGPTSTPPRVFATDIAATHTGQGYWVTYSDGLIVAFGDAMDMPGGYPSGATTTFALKSQKFSGVPGTYIPDDYPCSYMYLGRTGNTANGNPNATAAAFRNIASKYFHYGRVAYGYQFDMYVDGMCKAIASHPNKIGFWATDICGQVWGFGVDDIEGDTGFRNRTYAGVVSGDRQAASFTLDLFDRVNDIVSTDTGRGYWLLTASGMVAPFGDAIDKGPLNLDSINDRYKENKYSIGARFDAANLSDMYYGIARDQDGTGYWLLDADGSVEWYEAVNWGRPGWTGLTGYRWHEGNFNGDWADIVKDLAMWAGFTFYEPSKDSGTLQASPPEGYDSIKEYQDLFVLGTLESTAIVADVEISGEKWDKKTLLDVIRELSEVVAYEVFIDQEGGFRFQSPNWWRTGNFEYDGSRIYFTEDGEGVWTKVDEDAPGAQLFIPEIHESVNMMSYSATISNADKRSEIIIGTDVPDPRDISRTSHIHYMTPESYEEVSFGVPSMRGIPRVSMWTSHIFENAEERKLMAEMIAIRSHFARRSGTVNAIANPCIDLDDQVRVVERTTSENYIHRVRSISTNMDLESGSYTMDIQTHWLGEADNWALITTSRGELWSPPFGPEDYYAFGTRVSHDGSSWVSAVDDNSSEPGANEDWILQSDVDFPYVEISERLNAWQKATGRGLQDTAPTSSGMSETGIVFSSGSFEGIPESDSGPTWGVRYSGTGTASNNASKFPNVNYKSFGNGLLWPLETGATPLGYEDGGESYNAAKLRHLDQNFFLTVGTTPPHLSDDPENPQDGPPIFNQEEYIDAIMEMYQTYVFDRIIVWEDMEGLGYG